MQNRLHYPNPFQGNIVADAWESLESDVSSVHAQQLEVCARAVESIRNRGRSTSLLMYGDPGSGKTHLLARLRHHLLAPTSAEIPTRGLWFVYVVMRSTPTRLWQGLRAEFVKELLRRAEGQTYTQLESLLRERLAELRDAEGDLDYWWEYVQEEEGGEALLEGLESLVGNGDLTQVLFMMLRNKKRSAANSWLRGESLSEQRRRDLQLAEQEGEDREEEARQIVIALCKLTKPDQPLIFCFDQLEALQSHAGDHVGLFRFGQLVTDLHRETNHTLLISCVQTQFVDTLKAACGEAAYSRLIEAGSSFLQPLDLLQARQLVAARLEAARKMYGLESFPFTVSEQQLAQFMDSNQSCLPRELLAKLSGLYEQPAAEIRPSETSLSTSPPPFESETTVSPTSANPVPAVGLADYLENEWSRQLEKAQNKDSSSDFSQLFGQSLAALAPLKTGWKVNQQPEQRDIDLCLKHADGEIALAFCTEENMQSLGARLKRLLTLQAQSPWQKLIVMRHAQSPISKNAKACQNNWQALQKSGAEMFRPPVALLSVLEAMRELLTAAKTGDLSFQSQTVPLQKVEDWLCQELPEMVHQFWEELTGYPQFDTSETPMFEELTRILAEDCLLTLEEAAKKMSCDPQSLQRNLQQASSRFGLLESTHPEKPSLVYRLESTQWTGTV